MIKNITRGTVVFEFEGKTITLQGEAYLRGHGSPDFVVYENSAISWDPPHETEPVDDPTKVRLLAALLESFRDGGMTAILE
jgi:hypothetical protein